MQPRICCHADCPTMTLESPSICLPKKLLLYDFRLRVAKAKIFLHSLWPIPAKTRSTQPLHKSKAHLKAVSSRDSVGNGATPLDHELRQEEAGCTSGSGLPGDPQLQSPVRDRNPQSALQAFMAVTAELGTQLPALPPRLEHSLPTLTTGTPA